MLGGKGKRGKQENHIPRAEACIWVFPALGLCWKLYRSLGQLDRSKNGQPDLNGAYLRCKVNLNWVGHF